jgi:hypothetical protein
MRTMGMGVRGGERRKFGRRKMKMVSEKGGKKKETMFHGSVRVIQPEGFFWLCP